MGKKERVATIAWETIFGQRCQKKVAESEAAEWVEKIRSLPDVKTRTVRIVFGGGQ